MWPRSPGERTVGAGDVSLARSAGRGIDAAELTKTLHAAIEAGIDFISAAPEPDTEHLVGEAVRALRVRDRVTIATRVPAIVERSGAPTRDVLPERLPARYLQERIEATLRATRLEVIPLALVELRASWRTSSAWPELAGTCARLVREGKVLAWGAFVATIEDDTAELARFDWLTALDVPYSLCERAAAPLLALEATLEAAPTAEAAPAPVLTPEAAIALGPALTLVPDFTSALGLVLAPATESTSARAPIKPPAILARRPLAGGALAGTLGPGVKLRPDDDRRALDARQLERIAVHAAKLAAYVKQVPPAARSCDAAKLQLEHNVRSEYVECATLAELALRYVIDRGAIALPRLHRAEHVTEALAAVAAPPLSPALVEAIES